MTAFNIMDDNNQGPFESKIIDCRLVFDIKMHFTGKFRFSGGVNMTKNPDSTTLTGVVNNESVGIDYIIAALNGLQTRIVSINNHHINVPCHEQFHRRYGPEFVEFDGILAVIVSALYGL